MSGIITEPGFLAVFPKMNSNYKKGAIQALVVAIYEIGCLLGSSFIIGYGDKLGRRRAVLVGALIMLVGTAIQASSTTLAQLIVGRYYTFPLAIYDHSMLNLHQNCHWRRKWHEYIQYPGLAIGDGTPQNSRLSCTLRRRAYNRRRDGLLLDKLWFLVLQ